jgi:hypothetical protein
MSTDDHAEYIGTISVKMKQAFYGIAEGESRSESILAATMALALFIYELTDHGLENTVAQRSAELLVGAVSQLTKEDMN